VTDSNAWCNINFEQDPEKNKRIRGVKGLGVFTPMVLYASRVQNALFRNKRRNT
jgi:hypothetical protein